MIEILVLYLIVGFIILWNSWMFLSKKIKLWRYKPENDKGRRAEEFRRNASVQGTLLPERPSVFQTATPSLARQDSSSPRETSRSDGETVFRRRRNPFKRS
jgi:hypothetical protein